MLKKFWEKIRITDIIRGLVEIFGIILLGVFFPDKFLTVLLLLFIVVIAELADIF